MIFSSTKSRRLKLRSIPIPPEWREILHRHFPLLACLPSEDQRELEGHFGKAEGRRMNDEGMMKASAFLRSRSNCARSTRSFMTS